MKKKIQIMFAVVLMLSLTACGVPQEKLDAAQSTYDELVSLCDRTEAVCQNIETLEESASFTDGASDYSKFYSEMQSYRDSYAEAMQGIDKMSEAEVDALISEMQTEVESASETVAQLEEIGTELEVFIRAIESVEANTIKLQAVLETNPDEAFYTALQGLVDHYEEIESRLTTLQIELESEDLNVTISALKEVNEIVSTYSEQLEATALAFGG